MTMHACMQKSLKYETSSPCRCAEARRPVRSYSQLWRWWLQHAGLMIEGELSVMRLEKEEWQESVYCVE